jgi:2'-5' RNA ligase
MRCFVALWPDEATRVALDQLARSWHKRFARARRMRRANLHLTLAFIGELDAALAGRLATQLAGQTWPTGAWTLDRIGAFDRVRVLWAGCEASTYLDGLAGQVCAILDELQLRYDRKPFVPHVTLLRNLPPEAAGVFELLDAPIQWQATPPVLLRSSPTVDGVQYTPVTPDLPV